MAFPVEIVRPKHGTPTLLKMLAGNVASILYSAWMVMLLAPIVWHPVGYGWSLALVVIARNLFTTEAWYRFWTREATR